MKRRWLTIFAAGVFFGLGLPLSGMTDPRRVIGFLNVTGDWDPTLLFVMGGAVATFGLSVWVWRRRARGAGWFGTTLPSCNTDPIDGRLVLGAVIFGMGWGLGGFCPGPAIASLAGWRFEALLFVPAMAVGMWIERLVSRET